MSAWLELEQRAAARFPGPTLWASQAHDPFGQVVPSISTLIKLLVHLLLGVVPIRHMTLFLS